MLARTSRGRRALPSVRVNHARALHALGLYAETVFFLHFHDLSVTHQSVKLDVTYHSVMRDVTRLKQTLGEMVKFKWLIGSTQHFPGSKSFSCPSPFRPFKSWAMLGRVLWLVLIQHCCSWAWPGAIPLKRIACVRPIFLNEHFWEKVSRR